MGLTPSPPAVGAMREEESLDTASSGAEEVNAPDTLGKAPLHHASYFGHRAVGRLLLNHKARLDDTDSDGWRASHLAAMAGHGEVISELLGGSPDHPGEATTSTSSA